MIAGRGLALAWLLAVCLLAGHAGQQWAERRIVPDTDILALLPVQERDPVLQASFARMVDAAQQRVIVLVGAGDWRDAVRAADAYGAVLAQRPDLFAAPPAASASLEADWLGVFKTHRLVLMDAAQESLVRDAPPGYWAESALGRIHSAFAGPKIGAFRDDPFGLFAGWVQERAQETPVRPRDGRLFVEGDARQYVLLALTLRPAAFSVAAQEAALPLLEQAAAAARRQPGGVEVVSAGVVLHAGAAARQANTEVHTIGAGSLAGIVLLTWLTFRSLRPILLVLLSVGVGFLGALAVSVHLFGSVHLLTLVFGATLIGVAQDYGIYYLCHRLGASNGDVAGQMRTLLPGLALTLVAAVVGYLGLAVTPFPGLRQMAVFSGAGLAFAWLTVVCWFPLLAGKPRAPRPASAYCKALAHWPRAGRNAGTALAAGVLGVVVVAGLARIDTNDDIRSLQNPPRQLVADQMKLGRLLDAPSPVQYFLVRGASAQMVLEREEALKRRLEPLAAAGSIRGWQAVSNWVPSASVQAERRALADAKLLGGGGALARLASAIGEDGDWVRATRAHMLEAGRPLDVKEFLGSPPGEPWRHLWLGETGGVHASVVALRGLSHTAIPAVSKAGAGIDGVQWVDKIGEISTVLGRYRQNMGVVLLCAYAVVFGLLHLRYRARAWRVMAPTAIASVTTLALFGLAGQPVQLFHVLALMLLLGVGVDYGIFMLEHAGGQQRTAWVSVGLSAASAILSFGLLGLSATPALRAFGLTMLSGAALVWLLVPVFLRTKEGNHAQA